MSEPRTPPPWKAIAAMAENRVIGVGAKLPWHLPEDFKWFKRCTLGKVIVLGRKTFEGLGKPLPGRTNLVLTHHPEKLREAHPALFGAARTSSAMMTTHRPGQLELPGLAPTDLCLVTGLEVVEKRRDPREVFICGGASVYEQALPRCSELLLTRVKRTVAGDAFFPPFEHLFEFAEVIRETPEFTIERWVRNPSPAADFRR
jgi:dihydrofolate reductase